MDREALIGLVEKKHRFRVSPDDPVFMLATVSEVMLAEAKTELQRIVAEAMDQASAVNVQAEAAARAKAEAIVTKAGEWAADKIKQAGEAAATKIQGDLAKAEADAAVMGKWVRWGVIAAAVCSVAALSAAISTVVAVWGG